MANVDVSKVWGVGAKTSAKLKKMDINSVLDLKLTNPAKINFYFNVNIERIVVELNRIYLLSDYHRSSKKK
jgi:nucleotidyltransferase/DNA polymerase involved in DNA repair